VGLPKPVVPFALVVVPEQVTVVAVVIGEVASHAASARSIDAASAANGIKAIACRKVRVLTPHIFFMSKSAFCSIPNTDASGTERADCSRLAILGGGGLFQRNSMRCGISVTRRAVTARQVANSELASV
jgi:hypothetical protein